MLRSTIAGALAIVALGDPAQAGEVSFGIGYDNLFGQGSGAASFTLQANTGPVAELGLFDFGLGAAAEADTDGDLWGGGGLTAALPLGARWRIGASLMAGYYVFGDGEDLGSDIEFRSRLGVSRAVRAPWRVGLAIEHKSNGGIGDINPGVETLFLTFSRSF